MTVTISTDIKNLLVFLLDSLGFELLFICSYLESNSLLQIKLLFRVLVVPWVLEAGKT